MRVRLRTAVPAAALLCALAGPAGAVAAIENDAPENAPALQPATAENGPVAELQRTLSFDGAGPDAAAPRCLGPASFARTAWLRVAAAPTVRRLSLEAAVRDADTGVPDLAAYVQPGGGGVDVREPQACAGRETAGDPARGDAGAAVQLVVPAGAAVLVQVGWRAGDAAPATVASAASTPIAVRPAPPGQAFAAAPRTTVGSGVAVPLAGATTSAFDPAQPRCTSQAGVWRRVRIARRGVYAVAAAGTAASTVTVFGTTPAGDTAKGCADDGTTPALSTVFRTTRTGTHWLRVGVDQPELASARAGLAVVGPYATTALGRRAAPAAVDRAHRAIGEASCTDRRAARPAFDATTARSLRRGSRVVRGLNDGAACVAGRSTVARIVVAVARVRGGRCAWRVGRTFGTSRSCADPRGARAARGTGTWRTTLPAALPRGARYRVVVQAQKRTKGRLRSTGRRATLTVTR